MKRAITGLYSVILVACMASGVQSAAAADAAPDLDNMTPSATIELSGGTIAAGVGFSWGHGTLHFQNKDYPVSVSGISVASVGVSSIKATGNVYNLTKPSDLNDLFHVFSAGFAAGTGAGRVELGNTKGVELRLDAENTGLKLNVSAGGLHLHVDETPRASTKSP